VHCLAVGGRAVAFVLARLLVDGAYSLWASLDALGEQTALISLVLSQLVD
jgi:hypothetical protein